MVYFELHEKQLIFVVTVLIAHLTQKQVRIWLPPQSMENDDVDDDDGRWWSMHT